MSDRNVLFPTLPAVADLPVGPNFTKVPFPPQLREFRVESRSPKTASRTTLHYSQRPLSPLLLKDRHFRAFRIFGRPSSGTGIGPGPMPKRLQPPIGESDDARECGRVPANALARQNHFDEAVHLYTSFAVVAGIGRLAVGRRLLQGQLSRWWALLVVGIGLGLAWEVFEWAIGIIGSRRDTIIDLLMDTAGAAVASALVQLVEKEAQF
jgi:hypothetical protein